MRVSISYNRQGRVDAKPYFRDSAKTGMPSALNFTIPSTGAYCDRIHNRIHWDHSLDPIYSKLAACFKNIRGHIKDTLNYIFFKHVISCT